MTDTMRNITRGNLTAVMLMLLARQQAIFMSRAPGQQKILQLRSINRLINTVAQRLARMQPQ